jgi:hypothetical protein
MYAWIDVLSACIAACISFLVLLLEITDVPSNDNADPNATPKSRKRDPEFWIAIGALAVSAIAMFTSFAQVSLQRNQERMLVWPHVSAKPRYSSEGYAFIATNKGLGPALVRRVELRIDGKLVKGWDGALDSLLGKGHGYGWDKIQSNDLQDSILAATESKVLFGIPWDQRTRAAFGDGSRVTARICYCSFLEECWWSRDGLDHERVDKCPAP